MKKSQVPAIIIVFLLVQRHYMGNHLMFSSNHFHSCILHNKFEEDKVKDYIYLSEAPRGPMRHWPFRGRNFPEPKSISTCIPALAATVIDQLQPLLVASSLQTLLSREIVIVVSNVSNEVSSESNGTVWCANIWKSLTLTTETKLVCIGERLTAGRARNIAAHVSAGELISFIDADDQEIPIRNEVIFRMFSCSSDLMLLLHGYSKGSPKQIIGASKNNSLLSCQDWKRKAVLGNDLYLQLESTHHRWWLLPSIANGHMIIHRDTLEGLQFTSLAKGEDSLFIRDALYLYGRSDENVIFLNMPLTTYIKSNQANRDLLTPS